MSVVAAFAAAAEAYCAWAEGEPHNADEDAGLARLLLLDLCRAAIDLPAVEADGNAPEISDDDYQRVFRRFGSLPFNYYSKCFDPLIVPAAEPVTADLADDLADIWRDVKRGLLLYREGHTDAAVWQWRFHFDIHWAHHATAALYALQSWLSAHS